MTIGSSQQSTAIRKRMWPHLFWIIPLGLLAHVVTSPDKSTPAATPCRSDWTKCTDNADMANNYVGWTSAKVYCKIAAEDKAKYGTPEWPWLAFGTFYTGTDYKDKGIAILVEPKAKFQNGFGAMVHTEVICKYDLRAEKVADVFITD